MIWFWKIKLVKIKIWLRNIKYYSHNRKLETSSHNAHTLHHRCFLKLAFCSANIICLLTHSFAGTMSKNNYSNEMINKIKRNNIWRIAKISATTEMKFILIHTVELMVWSKMEFLQITLQYYCVWEKHILNKNVIFIHS